MAMSCTKSAESGVHRTAAVRPGGAPVHRCVVAAVPVSARRPATTAGIAPSEDDGQRRLVLARSGTAKIKVSVAHASAAREQM